MLIWVGILCLGWLAVGALASNVGIIVCLVATAATAGWWFSRTG